MLNDNFPFFKNNQNLVDDLNILNDHHQLDYGAKMKLSFFDDNDSENNFPPLMQHDTNIFDPRYQSSKVRRWRR